MANTISLAKVVDPGVKKHFVDGYKVDAPMLEKIFKIDKQESQTDEFKNYTGINQFSAVGEGETYGEDSPIQSYGTNLTASKFGKVIPITYELTRWAKVKDIWNAANMLGKAAARKIHVDAASVFNNGFNTAYTSYGDAKPLFSTSHTRADGGAAQSNASATGLVLSDDNLETGLLALEFQKDDRGELMDAMATQLVIPNDLRKTAAVILKSDLKSGSMDNDVNAYSLSEYYGTVKMTVWKYLSGSAAGSSTAWFLLAPDHKITWQWADKPQVFRDEATGFGQDVTKYKGRYIASKGWLDWRYAWGSKGNGGAYSD